MSSEEDVSAGVDTTTLDIDYLEEVQTELEPVESRYFEIGAMLHLKPDVLKGIQSRNQVSSSKAMNEMITEWLDKNYNIKKFGLPTWKSLVIAVAKRSGGANVSCAIDIANKHRESSSSVPPPSAAPSSTTSDHEHLKPVINYTKDPNFFHDAAKQKVETDGWFGNSKFDRYPPLSTANQTGLTVSYSFGTVKPLSGEKNSVAGVYEMKSSPHGIALIINNEVFKKQSKREGTEIDEKNLVQTFRYLGYTVEVHRNCESKKILDIMEDIRQRDHSSYDSFVCCILSHGKAGQIFGSDSVMISLEDITIKLNGDSCKSLASKPKVFFMQACRGTLKDTGVRIDADDDEMEAEPLVVSDSGTRVMTDSDTKIPDAADFYFGYATPLGHVAWRDLDNGSWYISELCKSLASYAKYANLDDIMKITNRQVGEVYSNVDYKQSPEATTRLRKDVFFF